MPSKSRIGRLSNYALDALDLLARHGPVPSLRINNGCCDKLHREGLIEYVQLPSPYAVDKGKNRRTHVKITQAGLERIKS